MPRVLPLYSDRPTTALERQSGCDRKSDCSACDLSSKRNKTTCIPPGIYGGEPGGLLVVGDYPSREDDNRGEHFVGKIGRYLRPLLKQWWPGSIALDNVIKCVGTRGDLDATRIAACRGYLKRTVEEVQPTRIVAMGHSAVASIMGRKVALLQNRKSYGWFYINDKPVPVYMLLNPYTAIVNRALRSWFEEDLERALSTDPPFGPVWEDGEVRIVETISDATLAADDIKRAGWFAYDVETSGFMWKAHQIVCAALNPAGRNYAWAWADVALRDASMRGVLVGLLRDPNIKKTGTNLKYDELATRIDLGAHVRGVIGDNRLLRKLLDGEASGYLEEMAELVGMGGHKGEAERALVVACRKVAKIAKANVSDQLNLIPMRGPVRQDVLKSIRPGERAKAYAYGFMPRDLCVRYCALDTVASGRLEILLDERRQGDDQALTRTYRDTVMPAAAAVRQMEEWGFYVDPDNIRHFQSYLQMKKNEALTRLKAWGGTDFNPGSPVQVKKLLIEKFGLPLTDSTDKDALEEIRHLHPVVEVMIEHRKVSKLDSNYATGLLRHVRNDGRIHSSILLDGTKTGRPSCIAGGCQVLTKRGEVPIQNVRVGDYVWSHRRRWCRVARTLRQGRRPVQNMYLSNGYVLTCTSDHNLLSTNSLWKEAITYASKQEVGQRIQRQGTETISRPEELHHSPDIEDAQHTIGECHSSAIQTYAGGRIYSSKDSEIFGQQIGIEESDVWEERSSTPQLEGSMRRRSWVPDDCVVRQTQVPSSCGHDEEVDGEIVAQRCKCAPHRRGPQEQQDRQSGVNNESRASAHTFLAGERLTVVICQEVQVGGSVEVYDLTVEEDESFLVCGIFAHNCTDPNLQTIPRDSDSKEGKMARDCFAAPPGYVLASLDYSQIELRVAAMLSKDPLMIELFEQGRDFHMATAEVVANTAWGIDASAVEKKHRSAAKAINFGLLYGMSNAGLAARLGCSKTEAGKIREAVLGKFSRLGRWIEEQLREAKRTGYCWTYWNGERARRRSLWQIYDKGHTDKARLARSTAENSSGNTPIQGTASDYLVRSLTESVNWILDNGIDAKVVLPVHDSILLEIAEDCVDEVVGEVHDIMVGWNSGDVPLVVDVEVGPSWGSLSRVAA